MTLKKYRRRFRDDRYDDTIDLIVNELAPKDFAEHVLVDEAPGAFFGRYFVGRPDTGICSFRVVFAPGTVIVFGDMGDAILHGSDHQMLPWLRGACRDRDYLLSKVQAAKEFKRFYPGDALAWLRAETKEHAERARLRRDNEEFKVDYLKYRQLLTDVEELFSCGEYHMWAPTVYEALGDPDACSMHERWSERLIWIAECLRLFVKLKEVADGR